MKTSIISIGSELLTGRTINTNSSQIAKLLFLHHIDVIRSVSIHDVISEIKQTLTDCLLDSDLCIITGGLGPTNDDITKHSLAEFFDDHLVLNESELERLESWFKSRNRSISEVNRQQAYYPSKSKQFINDLGTASGIVFEEDNKTIISLPGVPHEMQHLMEKFVIPYVLEKPNTNQKTSSLFFRLINKAESDVYTSLETVIKENNQLSFAFYPNFMLLDLIVKGPNKMLKSVEPLIQDSLQHNIFSRIENQTIQEVIGTNLIKTKKTIAAAESCTAGLFSFLLTEMPGASAFFKGSIVSYSNEIKQSELSVSTDVLKQYGAVSEECVVQMAQNIRSKFKTDYAVSISGIAGPDGGAADKPVGTVYFGIATVDKVFAVKRNLGKGRHAIQNRAAQYALYLIWNEFQAN